MSDLEINIKQSKADVTKISFECSPDIGYEIINNLSKDYNITIRVNSEGMSMASLIALSKTQFIYPDNN